MKIKWIAWNGEGVLPPPQSAVSSSILSTQPIEMETFAWGDLVTVFFRNGSMQRGFINYNDAQHLQLCVQHSSQLFFYQITKIEIKNTETHSSFYYVQDREHCYVFSQPLIPDETNTIIQIKLIEQDLNSVNAFSFFQSKEAQAHSQFIYFRENLNPIMIPIQSSSHEDKDGMIQFEWKNTNYELNLNDQSGFNYLHPPFVYFIGQLSLSSVLDETMIMGEDSLLHSKEMEDLVYTYLGVEKHINDNLYIIAIAKQLNTLTELTEQKEIGPSTWKQEYLIPQINTPILHYMDPDKSSKQINIEEDVNEFTIREDKFDSFKSNLLKLTNDFNQSSILIATPPPIPDEKHKKNASNIPNTKFMHVLIHSNPLTTKQEKVFLYREKSHGCTETKKFPYEITNVLEIGGLKGFSQSDMNDEYTLQQAHGGAHSHPTSQPSFLFEPLSSEFVFEQGQSMFMCISQQQKDKTVFYITPSTHDFTIAQLEESHESCSFVLLEHPNMTKNEYNSFTIQKLKTSSSPSYQLTFQCKDTTALSEETYFLTNVIVEFVKDYKTQSKLLTEYFNRIHAFPSSTISSTTSTISSTTNLYQLINQFYIALKARQCMNWKQVGNLMIKYRIDLSISHWKDLNILSQLFQQQLQAKIKVVQQRPSPKCNTHTRPPPPFTATNTGCQFKRSLGSTITYHENDRLRYEELCQQPILEQILNILPILSPDLQHYKTNYWAYHSNDELTQLQNLQNFKMKEMQKQHAEGIQHDKRSLQRLQEIAQFQRPSSRITLPSSAHAPGSTERVRTHAMKKIWDKLVANAFQINREYAFCELRQQMMILKKKYSHDFTICGHWEPLLSYLCKKTPEKRKSLLNQWSIKDNDKLICFHCGELLDEIERQTLLFQDEVFQYYYTEKEIAEQFEQTQMETAKLTIKEMCQEFLINFFKTIQTTLGIYLSKSPMELATQIYKQIVQPEHLLFMKENYYVVMSTKEEKKMDILIVCLRDLCSAIYIYVYLHTTTETPMEWSVLNEVPTLKKTLKTTKDPTEKKKLQAKIDQLQMDMIQLLNPIYNYMRSYVKLISSCLRTELSYNVMYEKIPGNGFENIFRNENLLKILTITIQNRSLYDEYFQTKQPPPLPPAHPLLSSSSFTTSHKGRQPRSILKSFPNLENPEMIKKPENLSITSESIMPLFVDIKKKNTIQYDIVTINNELWCQLNIFFCCDKEGEYRLYYGRQRIFGPNGRDMFSNMVNEAIYKKVFDKEESKQRFEVACKQFQETFNRENCLQVLKRIAECHIITTTSSPRINPDRPSAPPMDALLHGTAPIPTVNTLTNIMPEEIYPYQPLLSILTFTNVMLNYNTPLYKIYQRAVVNWELTTKHKEHIEMMCVRKEEQHYDEDVKNRLNTEKQLIQSLRTSVLQLSKLIPHPTQNLLHAFENHIISQLLRIKTLFRIMKKDEYLTYPLQEKLRYELENVYQYMKTYYSYNELQQSVENILAFGKKTHMAKYTKSNDEEESEDMDDAVALRERRKTRKQMEKYGLGEFAKAKQQKYSYKGIYYAQDADGAYQTVQYCASYPKPSKV